MSGLKNIYYTLLNNTTKHFYKYQKFLYLLICIKNKTKYNEYKNNLYFGLFKVLFFNHYYWIF